MWYFDLVMRDHLVSTMFPTTIEGPIRQTVFLHSHSLVPGANEHAKLSGGQVIRSC